MNVPVVRFVLRGVEKREEDGGRREITGDYCFGLSFGRPIHFYDKGESRRSTSRLTPFRSDFHSPSSNHWLFLNPCRGTGKLEIERVDILHLLLWVQSPNTSFRSFCLWINVPNLPC